MKMIFLVDGDNNINEGVSGIEMLSQEDAVLIFHQKGAALTKIKKAIEKSKANVKFIESVKTLVGGSTYEFCSNSYR